MIKLGIFVVLVILAVSFFSPGAVKNWKQKSLEFLNPAVKEKRLLGDLNNQITELSKVLNNTGLSEKEKNKKIGSILENTQSVVSELEDLNEKGDLTATVTNLIQKVLPKSKENTNPGPTWVPPGLIPVTECVPKK